jgi:hypothetical protein
VQEYVATGTIQLYQRFGPAADRAMRATSWKLQPAEDYTLVSRWRCPDGDGRNARWLEIADDPHAPRSLGRTSRDDSRFYVRSRDLAQACRVQRMSGRSAGRNVTGKDYYWAPIRGEDFRGGVVGATWNRRAVANVSCVGQRWRLYDFNYVEGRYGDHVSGRGYVPIED